MQPRAGMADLKSNIERRNFSNLAGRRVSWGAIFGGAFIALGVILLLGAFGAAIDATFSGGMATSPGLLWSLDMGIGTGIWWIISAIIAFFVGGVIAGRLAGLRRRWEGPLHGLVVWALGTIAAIALTVGMFGGMSRAAGLSVVGQSRIPAVATSATDQLPAAASAVAVAHGLAPAGRMPGDIRYGYEPASLAAGASATDPVVEAEVAEVAATGPRLTTAGAWFGFAYLILTACAAGLGGMAGVPRERGPLAPAFPNQGVPAVTSGPSTEATNPPEVPA